MRASNSASRPVALLMLAFRSLASFFSSRTPNLSELVGALLLSLCRRSNSFSTSSNLASLLALTGGYLTAVLLPLRTVFLPWRLKGHRAQLVSNQMIMLPTLIPKRTLHECMVQDRTANPQKEGALRPECGFLNPPSAAPGSPARPPANGAAGLPGSCARRSPGATGHRIAVPPPGPLPPQ